MWALWSEEYERKKKTSGATTYGGWERFAKVSADILGPITKGKKTGAKYILAMTDHFTKYVVSIPVQEITSQTIAKKTVEEWILTYGVSDVIHTDPGANFCGSLMDELRRLLKIDKSRTSPYHPEGNGQVERHNRVIADVLSLDCDPNT